jgi:hypothetical protein
MPPGVAITINGRSLTAVGPDNAILAHIQSVIEHACQIRFDTLSISHSRFGEHSAALATAGIGGTAAFGFGLDKDPQIAGIKALLAIANRLFPQTGIATKAA